MDKDISESVKRGLEQSARYRNIWGSATTGMESPVVAEVVEPYVHGSLRPEVTRLSATIGQTIVSITNCEAAFSDATTTVASLETLETIASSEG